MQQGCTDSYSHNASHLRQASRTDANDFPGHQLEWSRSTHQNFHNAAAFLFRDSHCHAHSVEDYRYVDQDITGNADNISCCHFARRAVGLTLLGVHDGKAWLSKQATRLSRGETQAMRYIEEVELLRQDLYLGEIGVVCGGI